MGWGGWDEGAGRVVGWWDGSGVGGGGVVLEGVAVGPGDKRGEGVKGRMRRQQGRRRSLGEHQVEGGVGSGGVVARLGGGQEPP